MDQTTQEPEDVHKVKMKKPERKYPKPTGRDNPNRKPSDDNTSDRPCDFCGRKHRKGRTNCAAWGRICGACGKKKTTSRPSAEQERKHTMLNLKKTTPARKNYCIA